MTTPAEILAAVENATGCDPERIRSKCRKTSVLYPRYLALILLRESRPFFSDMELGQLIGIEGVGTTRAALIRAKEMLASDGDFQLAHKTASATLKKTA